MARVGVFIRVGRDRFRSVTFEGMFGPNVESQLGPFVRGLRAAGFKRANKPGDKLKVGEYNLKKLGD